MTGVTGAWIALMPGDQNRFPTRGIGPSDAIHKLPKAEFYVFRIYPAVLIRFSG